MTTLHASEPLALEPLTLPSPHGGEGSRSYIPSPLWGEGRVRGAVCETPRDYARGLRRRQTDAERRLWLRLRDRRLLGVKFSRQVPIGPYVVDFCCRERRLVIELDGGQHALAVADDAERTEYLERLGYRILRFWNHDALGNTEGVLDTIARALGHLNISPSPRPSPRGGEGEAQHG